VRAAGSVPYCAAQSPTLAPWALVKVGAQGLEQRLRWAERVLPMGARGFLSSRNHASAWN